MVVETQSIGEGRAALRFALGCLWTVIALRSSSRHRMKDYSMPFAHPRRIAALCAAGAVGLGFGYMAAAGAPASYFAMNGAAFLIGLLALGVILELGRTRPIPGSLVTLTLAGFMLAVAFWGVSADGVSRWVAVGGVALQPSLILTPVIALGFVHYRDRLSASAVMVCALALALQPDRAMSAALVAGVLPVTMARRGWLELAVLAAASLGLGAAMIQADGSPAMPFVDQILFSSFAVHPATGLAVWCGAALMIVPAILGYAYDPGQRVAYASFGFVWLAVIAAAALGNYPTPLVGYGGSAILGYLISLVGLPKRTTATERRRSPKREPAEQTTENMLRAGLA